VAQCRNDPARARAYPSLPVAERLVARLCQGSGAGAGRYSASTRVPIHGSPRVAPRGSPPRVSQTGEGQTGEGQTGEGQTGERGARVLDLDQLLRFAVEQGSSDVHVKVGSRPRLRID